MRRPTCCNGLALPFAVTYLLAPASLLTPFTYLQMVWAVGYGYLIFDQLPDRWSALGMSVIVAGGLLLALQERQRARWPRTTSRR